MGDPIYLTATSDFGAAGKQHVGLVVGPDPKWGCALQFVGKKSGKRGDITEVAADRPALYKVRSATASGTRYVEHDDKYILVWELDGDLVRTEVSELEARALASDLSVGNLNAVGRRLELVDAVEMIAAAADKPQEAIIEVREGLARKLGCPLGAKMTRAAVLDLRRAYAARLRGDRTPGLPIEIGEAPSDPAAHRAQLERRVADLRAQLEQAERQLAALAIGTGQH